MNNYRIVELTREEVELVYVQLQARIQYFEEDLMHWAEQKDLSEVRRCIKAIDRIKEVQSKLLG